MQLIARLEHMTTSSFTINFTKKVISVKVISENLHYNALVIKTAIKLIGWPPLRTTFLIGYPPSGVSKEFMCCCMSFHMAKPYSGVFILSKTLLIAMLDSQWTCINVFRLQSCLLMSFSAMEVATAEACNIQTALEEQQLATPAAQIYIFVV